MVYRLRLSKQYQTMEGTFKLIYLKKIAWILKELISIEIH